MPTATLRRMGKKKPNRSGKNVTPRTPMQIPDVWLDVMRDRARAAMQPTLWYLLRLVDADARAAGIQNLPPLPWDKEADAAE